MMLAEFSRDNRAEIVRVEISLPKVFEHTCKKGASILVRDRILTLVKAFEGFITTPQKVACYLSDNP